MSEEKPNNEEGLQPEAQVSPDQLSMFEETVAAPEEPARLEIPHEAPALYQFEAGAAQNTESDSAHAADAEETSDQISGSRKIKILAALAIVAVAGYVAYWVQEPVQIKADVTSPATLEGDTESDTPDKLLALDNTLSDRSGLPKGPSVNVDVSLFGFEPATVEIEKGTTVIWTNTSPEDQTIVGSSEDGQSFVSPVLTSGESFTYQFDQDATFQYYSTYNPALKALITVGSGALPAMADSPTEPAGNTPPAGTVDPATALPPASNPGDVLETAIDQSRQTDGEQLPEQVNPLVTGQQLTASNSPDPALTTIADLKPAADESAPGKLSKTGPEDLLYLLLILGIGWLNRGKLRAVLRRY